MSTKNQAEGSKRTPYGKWYESNKGALSEARRDRYKNDPDYRAKVAAQNRDFRAKKAKSNEEPARKFRDHLGSTVEVFTIARAAEVAGRNEQSIRIWEEKGYIPKPSFTEDAHRLYTQGQLDLIAEMSETMTEVRYQPAVRAQKIADKAASIQARWIA